MTAVVAAHSCSVVTHIHSLGECAFRTGGFCKDDRKNSSTDWCMLRGIRGPTAGYSVAVQSFLAAETQAHSYFSSSLCVYAAGARQELQLQQQAQVTGLVCSRGRSYMSQHAVLLLKLSGRVAAPLAPNHEP
jgi:hypothetical protein